MARNKHNQNPPPPVAPAPRRVPPLEGMRLPPFTGDKHACVKCGNAGAKTIYLPSGGTCVHFFAEGSKTVWGVERLHRICERCAFPWDEACVAPVTDVKTTLVMPAVPSVRKDRRYG